jgi:hypothetical protein
LIQTGPKNILFQFTKTRIKVKLTAIFGHPGPRHAALQHFQRLILGQPTRMTCSLCQRLQKWLTKTICYDIQLNGSLLRIQACENCALPINLIKKELRKRGRGDLFLKLFLGVPA